MGILKKKKVILTSEEFADKLLKFQQCMTHDLFEEFKQSLKENGLLIEIKDDILFIEIGIICFWVIFRAFREEGKKDEQFLNILIERHLEEVAQLYNTEKEKNEAVENEQNLLTKRFEEYFDAWDDSSGGNQTILSIKILECLGVPKDNLFDFFMTFFVTTWILEAMSRVLEFSLKFEIEK